MGVKFNEKAIAIYGVAQLAEGVSAINKNPTGVIATTIGSAAVTGTGTKFLTEVTPNAYLFTSTGAIIGRVLSVASDTSLTLEDVVPASATPQSAGVMALATAITGSTRTITGTITTVAGSTAVSGTNFVVDGLAAGDTLYVGGIFVGVIASVTSAIALVLADPANGAMSTNTAATYTAKVNAFTTGLGPKNALAVLNLNYATELTTEAFQYTGNELDRSETTVIKDKFAKMDFEVFIPALGTIAGGDPVVSEVPMVDWWQAAGFAIVLSTGSNGYAKITNSVSSNAYLTLEVRRSSPDLATVNLQKTFAMTDVRGTIDLDGTVGTKGKLKFNYMGNLDNVTDKMTLVPNFADQKTMLAPSISSKTTTLSELTLYVTDAEPTIAGVSNICFDKLNAPNVAGFDYQRYQTSCLDGWSKGATPSDVTLTIIEDKASATYNPDNHLEENHKLTLRYGSVTGKKVEFTFHKLQLGKVTASKVATYSGQDLGFRNIDYTDIKLY